MGRATRNEASPLEAARAEPFDDLEQADLAPLLRRIGDARIVLIGEATHGTSEFYRMRARITRELIERKGFNIVAVEADWPDAERIDEYARARARKPERAWRAFSRFPSWMWRNAETLEFVEWLKERNAALPPERRAGFYGLDLYSMGASMQEVIGYLEPRDAELADLARWRYGSLLAFDGDFAEYGRQALRDRYASREDEVVLMLTDLLAKRIELPEGAEEGERFFDASRNAALVSAAEKYYRLLYRGSYASWNQRDGHMFSTLEAILANRGLDARAVVWAHNSHVGDAGRTEMSRAGETNIGELAREAYGERAFIVGFGTHAGTVAAADDWGGEVEIKRVQPSRPGSYERLFHEWGEGGNFLLPLRGRPETRELLGGPLLERAIGVIYRPRTELQSHYFEADLAAQFDEHIWFDETRAVAPLSGDERSPALPERHPFLLAD